MKKILILFLSLTALICFGACSSTENNKEKNNVPDKEASATTPPIDDSKAIKIDFTDDTVTSSSEIVQIEGTIAKISSAGTYELSGICNSGQVVVDAEDADIYFIFNGITLNCENSAPINIANAKNVYISLADGTVNTISDSDTYELESGTDEPDATIFSKGDLNISGNGTLNVNSVHNDGIASRDKLVIESGIINVNAKNHGIKGKDFLSVIGGEIKVIAGTDGIKATNYTDSEKGYVTISGGKLDINAQDEAISAETYCNISGGELKIATANNGIKASTTIDVSGGKVEIDTEDKGLDCTDVKISSKADVSVNGEKVASNY